MTYLHLSFQLSNDLFMFMALCTLVEGTIGIRDEVERALFEGNAALGALSGHSAMVPT